MIFLGKPIPAFRRLRASKKAGTLWQSAPVKTSRRRNGLSGSRRPWCTVARIALEEQCLACHRGNHGRLERLGDQKRRLRTLAGQESLRIGGDEHHRDFEAAQQLVDGIEAGG